MKGKRRRWPFGGLEHDKLWLQKNLSHEESFENLA
jgi:hypothetical protein